jgi:hypothetical protein
MLVGSHLIVFAIAEQNNITNPNVSANFWVIAYQWLANVNNFATSNKKLKEDE